MSDRREGLVPGIGRKLVAAVLAALGALAILGAGSASAALDHPFQLEFDAGCPVTEVQVDEVHDYLYVACAYPGFFPRYSIKRFDLQGNPVDFTASEPYLSGNEITYNPGAENKEFGAIYASFSFAIDNSSAHPGYIFTGDGANRASGSSVGGAVNIFKPSGEYANQIFSPTLGPITGVDVNAEGNLFTAQKLFQGGRIDEWNSAFQQVGRIFSFHQNLSDYLRADSSDAVWVGGYCFVGKPLCAVRKYENDQFHPSQLTVESEVAGAGLPVEAASSPYAANPLLPDGANAFDVDPTNDDVLINLGDRIVIWSKGDAEEPSYQDNPPVGVGKLSSSSGVAIDAGRDIYAGVGESVLKFGAGDTLPDVHSFNPEIDDVGRTSATLRGRVELLGGDPVTECEIEYGPTTEYNSGGSPPPDSGVVPCDDTSFSADQDVSASIPGGNPPLVTGQTYHYRFVAGNDHGSNAGVDRTVTTPAVVKLHTGPASDIDSNSATLNGSFDPLGLATEYFFEYGLDSEYGQSTDPVTEPAGSGARPVSSPVAEIASGTVFHYRLVARNTIGTTLGPDVTFRSASTPEVSGVQTKDNLAQSATLVARVNPVGYETSYRFEYGKTPAYGLAAPASPEAIGSGTDPVTVEEGVSGLEPGVTYHFRVVATNQWGTSTSADTTFDYAPPSCPNEHVRQETHASYLPDCRAYEIVSREDAGSILMFPSDVIFGFDFGPHCESSPECKSRVGKLWAVNSGLAQSPSRFAYFGGLGAYADINSPNALLDMYIATRTNNGWVSALPSTSGSEALFAARPRCDDALSTCTTHSEGIGLAVSTEGQETSASYFSAAGKRLGTLPTNVDSVPGARHTKAEDQYGDEMLSGDGSHYVFSSTEHVFADGGKEAVPGSAYDNDIGAQSVNLISLDSEGFPIEQDDSGNPLEYIEFDGISKDGSHILMHVKGADGPEHLYMRVDDSLTYDVSQGHGVTFIGMTEDGGKVIFAAGQQLVPQDTDTSTDIYEWDENGSGNKLTLLSQGNGNGEGDECAPVGGWTSGCDAVPLSTERFNPFGFSSAPPLDDHIASGSGDVYFYSPEQLDPERAGVTNQRNLYVYREGAPHLVATFGRGTEINRMQISPDGAHAGFLTAASLTGYDTHGFKEMYAYDVDQNNLLCASCRPDGLPPTGDAVASQGGPFMSDDGSVFFTSKDALVPRDVNGSILDVYEYAGGRPQLISSGTGSRDFTAGGSVQNLLGFPKSARTGLESVSANGQDVFFSTYDVLVPQDKNGPFVKFYDARVGGGFTPTPEFAPCSAADECHGDEAPAASPPEIGSEANLGSTGNAKADSKEKAKKKKSKKSKKKKNHKKHGGAKRAHGRNR